MNSASTLIRVAAWFSLLFGPPIYGWCSGGAAGLLVMTCLVVFLIFGAVEVAIGGWAVTFLAALKWLLIFAGIHFTIFCFNEELALSMLQYIETTYDRLVPWLRSRSISEQFTAFVAAVGIALLAAHFD